jgi:protein gp37
MFRTVTRTWNPVVGCLYHCSYCWAKELAETKLRDSPRYQDGFKPKLVEKELKRRFKPGEFIFVTDMGDLFGPWVPREWILRVLHVISQFPETDFLLQTKNPDRYQDFEFFPPHFPNVYLGTTIETNRNYHLTRAPRPYLRFYPMWLVPHHKKFISIEPIMDFDLDELVTWVAEIKPEIVEVGADNYNNNLPEPPWWKVEALLARLREICPRVEEKEGLERLRGA